MAEPRDEFPNQPVEAVCALMASPDGINFSDRYSPSGWLRVFEDVRRHAAKMPDHERQDFAEWIAALNQTERSDDAA